jgi:hypothetical protein
MFITDKCLFYYNLSISIHNFIILGVVYMRLQIGTGREKITPKLGTRLFGYPGEIRAKSLHDDLTVTAFAISGENHTVVMMSVTVCLLDNETTAEIRTRIGKELNIPAAHVILSATHTHTGPFTEKEIDAVYCNEILIPRCINAAKTAMGNLQPAKVGIGTTASSVGINRRQLLNNGTVILGQNPWGVHDPEMTVISFKNQDGKPLANMIHFAAHCTAAGMCSEISRDWAGVMTDRLEAETGVMTGFFNSSLGDVAPRMANGGSTGDMSHAMEVGGLAGIDAVRAFHNIRAAYAEPLDTRVSELRIPQTIISAEAARQEIARNEAIDPQTNYQDERIKICKEILNLQKDGDTACPDWVFEQTIIRIGPLVFVPIPFEPFSEISLRLRAYSPYGFTLVLGCTNGSYSYLPTQDQLCRGGYEVEMFLWARARRLPDDADAWMIRENLRIIKTFKEGETK